MLESCCQGDIAYLKEEILAILCNRHSAERVFPVRIKTRGNKYEIRGKRNSGRF